jgi:hypothetical protein
MISSDLCLLHFCSNCKPRPTIVTDKHTILNIGCFKKSFTNLKEYINLFRGHVQCFKT